jgi:hypothetical protein
VSGLDVLAPFQNQIPADSPILVIADHGAGEMVDEVGSRQGHLVLVNPSPEEMRVAARAHIRPIVVREVSLDGRPASALGWQRPAEDAWVDLAAEARRGYPIEPSELAAILKAMQSSGISWRRLASRGRRRGMPLRFVPSRPLPIAIDGSDPFWSQVGGELEWSG